MSSPSAMHRYMSFASVIYVQFENWWQTLTVHAFAQSESNVLIHEFDKRGGYYSDVLMDLPTAKSAGSILKLSILAQGESLKVMLDNKEVFTRRLEIINTNSLHQFSVKIYHNPLGKTELLFHGYCLKIE
ncbi:uncharacterized protein LOC132725895 [Ruditapes philippinarum]|uniref:uncharacterized protein LOC132725895 n=1 Tax=Ruditapes philippinarum TaxID=129788 RepID=UPI00295C0B77|nr:uncharacterized protein LOC132725895 [Ruditapes philippinarum]